MAIDIDHSTQSIMATGDPFIDGYLTLSAPGGGYIIIDGPLQCTNTAYIGNLEYPTFNDASQFGKYLSIREYGGGNGDPHIALVDITWDEITDKPIFADVATSGSFNDLTDKPLVFSGAYNDLTGKPVLATVATSGSYNDLTDKPVGGGSVDYGDVTNTPVLASVATSGSYADLSNKPALAAVAISGNYEDLVGAPTGGGGLVDYADITNKPTLATVATSGDYADLTNKPTIPTVPTLATVATSGAYADLSGKPTLATVATSGSYNDLTDLPVGDGPVDYADVTNTPVLSTVATSGDYADLTNKPTLFSGAYADLSGKPTLATVATSGSYNDLSDKPTDQVGIAEVAADLSPTLGGDLEVGDKVIKADSGILQLKTAGNGGFPGGMVYVDGSRMVFSNIDAVGSGRYHPVTSDPISEVTIAVEDGVSDIRLFATGGNIVLDPGLKAVQIGGNGYVSGLSGNNLWLSTIGPGALILGGSQDGVSTAPDILVSSPVKFVGTASITHSDTNQGIAIDGNGTGRVVISGQSFPKTAGTSGQVLTCGTGGNLTWATPSGGGGGGAVGYAFSGTPTTAPTATGLNGVAIGNAAKVTNGGIGIGHHAYNPNPGGTVLGHGLETQLSEYGKYGPARHHRYVLRADLAAGMASTSTAKFIGPGGLAANGNIIITSEQTVAENNIIVGYGTIRVVAQDKDNPNTSLMITRAFGVQHHPYNGGVSAIFNTSQSTHVTTQVAPIVNIGAGSNYFTVDIQNGGSGSPPARSIYLFVEFDTFEFPIYSEMPG